MLGIRREKKNDITSYYQRLFNAQKEAKKNGAVCGSVYNGKSAVSKTANVIVIR